MRALEHRLAELGYVEGRNLVIDFRTAGGQPERIPVSGGFAEVGENGLTVLTESAGATA